ncbi:MAG TPA: hypothetical protein VIN65_09240 [Candidatus Dormibacteraeota bacterium]|jgi:hypothetical protein
MIAAIVIAALVLMALVVWGLGRRQSPPHSGRADSDLKDAFVGILMTVGPFFGVRYKPPRVEIPVVMTPAADDVDPATAGPRPGDEDEPPPRP